ncbi:MAG: hypothetical protein KatS3mg082_2042 [Nitrospiraceae bacterium]|nr:MAG: hypothetical protein KatS3mg082_2042 [Nitrospiraceae bacterium]
MESHRPDDGGGNWRHGCTFPSMRSQVRCSDWNLKVKSSAANSDQFPNSTFHNVTFRRSRADRMVSSPPPGPHPSAHRRSSQERDRTGDGGRVHAVSVAMAACGARLSPTRGTGLVEGHRATGRIRGRPRRPGESQILRVRMAKYEPEMLDRLCLSGAVSWGATDSASSFGRRRGSRARPARAAHRAHQRGPDQPVLPGRRRPGCWRRSERNADSRTTPPGSARSRRTSKGTCGSAARVSSPTWSGAPGTCRRRSKTVCGSWSRPDW